MSYYKTAIDRPTPRAEQNRVLLCVWTAFECMYKASAGRAEWAHLADAINIVESLCCLGKFDPKRVMPHVTVAQAAMVEAVQWEPGPMRMSETGLSALAEVCTFYDNALFKFSVGTLNRARDYFIGVQVKHAISPESSTLVVMP